MRTDFNNSIATFQETIEQVLLKNGQINDNAMAMNEAANNLSKRTEQQAAALEQTAASLEEVTSTVKASVERTAETRNLVGMRGHAHRSPAVLLPMQSTR